jgi:hypothetical protein
VAHIDVNDTSAWAEPLRLPITVLDNDLEDSIATQVLAKLAVVIDVTSWLDLNSTPEIVRKIIAMQYVASYINRSQSSEEDLNNYALWLWANAETLIDGLIAGTLVLDPTVPPDGTDPSSPLYYPTDASSAQEPTPDDMSLGGPAFSMGRIW